MLLPNAPTVGGNTRWVIGFVESGAYSFTRGCGGGVGFVSALGLVYMLHVNKGMELLFRNINTFEYVSCGFDIFL